MSERFPKLGWGFSRIGKLAESWPKDPQGEPLPGAFLKHCSCLDMEDEIICNFLESFGIPCLRRYPNDGALGQVVLGMSGNGVDLYVPADKLEDAIALISEENQYDDDDEQ